jgi:hypothetical protein
MRGPPKKRLISHCATSAEEEKSFAEFAGRIFARILTFACSFATVSSSETVALQQALFPGGPMLADPVVHTEAKFWLDVGDAAIKFVALLVGAAWTWMNYRRGRIYTHKPMVRTTGRLFTKSGELYVSILCELKNIGQSKYEIEQEGTACRVWAITDDMPTPEELIWLSSVFTQHGWMEPGGEIVDPLLIRIPPHLSEAQLVGIRVGLRVVSAGVESNTSCIIEIPDSDQTATHGAPLLEMKD